jgi:hypothetical protein
MNCRGKAGLSSLWIVFLVFFSSSHFSWLPFIDHVISSSETNPELLLSFGIKPNGSVLFSEKKFESFSKAIFSSSKHHLLQKNLGGSGLNTARGLNVLKSGCV